MEKKTKKTLYAAYGSNLNIRQMAMRCPTAEVVGTAMLKGYELLFRNVATVEPKQGGVVPLLIWSLEPRDEAALDRYEGFPDFYRKEYHNIEVNGETVKVMLYIMNAGHEISEPSQYYFEVIRQGYRSAGFNVKTLAEAAERSTGDVADEKITDELFDQIMEIRNSGAANMFDIRRVQREANERGFLELVAYLEDHRKEYTNFILNGER